MKHSPRFLLGFGVLLGTGVPTAIHAHFRLLQPASWLIENEIGDPQKAGPCGGTNDDWGKPSYIITSVTGGQKLHIKVQETVYHPGHYRVALAVNSPTELPRDPVATTRTTKDGPWSVSGAIQDPPQIPVLADGLWRHTTPVDGPLETDVQLPNINCKNCTLQVVQFMTEHGVNNPGNFTYHHCAALRITADPAKPIDKRWPAERRPHILDMGRRLETPPINALRSLAMCNEQSLLVENAPVAARESDRWPAPREGANPVLGMSWPKEEPLAGQWRRLGVRGSADYAKSAMLPALFVWV